MSSSLYQPPQPFSLGNPFALDDKFDPLFEYASGQGSGGQQSEPVNDEPVEENNIDNNHKKSQGFWTKVLDYFEKEMKESKSGNYSLSCKRKNRFRPKVSQFGAIYDNNKRGNQNLNNEAANSEDVAVQEVRPLGHDRSKKKASATRSESSSAGEPSLVEPLLNKWKNITIVNFLMEGNLC
ncbi:hypothetical protein Tco_1490075 [Tanacetum coccineum]